MLAEAVAIMSTKPFHALENNQWIPLVASDTNAKTQENRHEL